MGSAIAWPKQKGWAEQEKLQAKQRNWQVEREDFFQCFVPEYGLFSRTTSSGVNKSMRRFAEEVETGPEIFIHAWLLFP